MTHNFNIDIDTEAPAGDAYLATSLDGLMRTNLSVDSFLGRHNV